MNNTQSLDNFFFNLDEGVYNSYLFNQLVTSVRNKSLMQNVLQEMDQFSGVKHFKISG